MWSPVAMPVKKVACPNAVGLLFAALRLVIGPSPPPAMVTVVFATPVLTLLVAVTVAM